MILHPSRGALRSYHDRQLAESRAGEVARHLERCARCRARLAEIEHAVLRVRQLFEALEVETVPVLDLSARRVATARLERAPFGHWEWFRRPLPLPAPALIAAGLALVLFGWTVGTRPRTVLEVQEPTVETHEPAPEAQLVVVAEQGPSGRETRSLSVRAGNYRFIQEPTVYTSP